MFSLFKRNKKEDPVPEWVSFFNQKEYNTFIGLVEAYFKNLNLPIVIQEGVVIPAGNAFGYGEMGLSNIAQMCRAKPQELWAGQIAVHFETLHRSNQFEEEFKKRANDFEYIRQFIAVRLFNMEVIRGTARSIFIKRDFLDDVFAMACFDFPDGVRNIKPEEAEKWKHITEDDLFTIGLQNVRDNYNPGVTREKLDNFFIWISQGDHFFVPNILFDLEQYTECRGSYGTLAGIPTRHLAFFYPVNDLEVVTTITSLIQVIAGMYKDGPGSLSPNLYWYYEGKFENLPYELSGPKIEFRPSARFLDVLALLERPEGVE